MAVSDATRDYLWILARTPQVDKSVVDPLRGRLAAKGFDVSKLESTPHR